MKGTIDQFSGHPDWSLALEAWSHFDGGNTGNSTDGWRRHLDDRRLLPAYRASEWEASFYSNLVEDNPQTIRYR